MLDTTTGEVVNRALLHEGHQVRECYFELARPVLVGIEAIGPMQWFLNLLEELGIECRVGDAAKIRAAEPRKQKHDRRDAELILKLLVEKRFPAMWMPTKEQLDVRALLLHGHQWVRLRTRIQNALQAIALANGLRRGSGLWSYDGQAKIAFLPLPPHASYRRSALQAMYRKMQEEIENLSAQVAAQAGQRCGARLLTTHPGVGPLTALATDVFLGDPQSFADGKAVMPVPECLKRGLVEIVTVRLMRLPLPSGSSHNSS
jgi:transposase